MRIKVVFYDTESGAQPAMDYLNALPLKMRAKMLWTIKLFENNGTDLREPYSKKLRDEIFELRAKKGSDISRVLYFFVHDGKAVLTHGFTKKSQRTPAGEIERAMRYREEYLSRKEKQQ